MLLDRIHERGDRPPHGRVRSSGARFDRQAHASGLARTTSGTASARGPLRPRGARSEVGNEWVLSCSGVGPPGLATRRRPRPRNTSGGGRCQLSLALREVNPTRQSFRAAGAARRTLDSEGHRAFSPSRAIPARRSGVDRQPVDCSVHCRTGMSPPCGHRAVHCGPRARSPTGRRGRLSAHAHPQGCGCSLFHTR